MSDAIVHIDAWESAGLIDAATAERLRAASAAAAVEVGSPGSGMTVASAESAPRPTAAAAMFGPSVTIAEVFGYLGGAFLVAAWGGFAARFGEGQQSAIGVMALIAATVLTGIGIAIAGRSQRASRAAGVVFITASASVAAAIAAFANAAGVEWPAVGVLAAATALVAAVGLRVVHPAVLTQVGMLTWITALAAASQAWVAETWFTGPIVPAPADGSPIAAAPGADPMILVIGSAVWWLATAVLIALIGLREATRGERDGDPAASRRAAVTRFWAGITAVAGLGGAVTRSADLGNGAYGRVLEPWIGVLAMLVLTAVLVERAFRRDATSFIYAAALGLIVALTDLNVSYLSDSTDVALLVEGLILLGVGFGADRLRRRIGRPPPPLATGDPGLRSDGSPEGIAGEPA